jgi:TPR repeat protein
VWILFMPLARLAQYANGEGVDQDPAEAVKWYRRSAEQNHMAGQHHLADA